MGEREISVTQHVENIHYKVWSNWELTCICMYLFGFLFLKAHQHLLQVVYAK